MNYTKLGNSDLNVSRICMGCMGFGNAATGQHSWTLDEEHSREIIRRVEETAQKRGVSMTEVALAWLLGKVTVPVVGATKVSHIETAAKAVDLQLTAQRTLIWKNPTAPIRWRASWRRTNRPTPKKNTFGPSAVRKSEVGTQKQKRLRC